MSLISRFRKLNDNELNSVPADTRKSLPSFFIHLDEMTSFEVLQDEDWAVILKDLIELEVTLLDAAVRLRLLSQVAFASAQFQRAFLVCAVSLRIGPKRQEWDKYSSQDIIIKARQALEDFQTALGHVYKNQKTIVNIVMTAYPDVCLCLLARYRWGPSTFTNPTSNCVLMKFIFSHNFIRVLDNIDEKLMKTIRRNYQYFHDVLKKREEEIRAKKPEFPGFLLKDTEAAISSVTEKKIPLAVVACSSIINDCLDYKQNEEVAWFEFKQNSPDMVAMLNKEAQPDVNTELKYPKIKKSFMESKAAILKKKKEVELEAIQANKQARLVKRENASLITEAIKAKKEGIARMSQKDLDKMLGTQVNSKTKKIEEEEEDVEELAGVTSEEKTDKKKKLSSLLSRSSGSANPAVDKAQKEVQNELDFGDEKKEVKSKKATRKTKNNNNNDDDEDPNHELSE